MYTIVDEDLRVTQSEIEDHEIPAMLDSGFIAGVLRVNNGVIEYAEVDWKEHTVTWKVPEVINYND